MVAGASGDLISPSPMDDKIPATSLFSAQED